MDVVQKLPWTIILKHHRKELISLSLFFLFGSALMLAQLIPTLRLSLSPKAQKESVTNILAKDVRVKGYIVELAKDSKLTFRNSLARQRKTPTEMRDGVNSYIGILSQEHSMAKKEIAGMITAGSTELLKNRIMAEFTAAFNGFALNINSEEAESISHSSFVRRMQPNYELKPLLYDSVPLIKADKVWQLTDSNGKNITGTGINVAIVDTGIDYTHPDLGGGGGGGFNSKVVGGYDFINNDTDPMDDYGHGTHVAAIAGSMGLKGVAPGARLYAYKVFDSNGFTTTDVILSAFDAAANSLLDNDPTNDIAVMNFSGGASCKYYYGGYNEFCGPDDILSQSVDRLADGGVVPVISAGNDGALGPGSISSPGTARNAITVGAVKKDRTFASDFSSQGPVFWNGEDYHKPDILAPGVSICGAELPGFYPDNRCLDDKHIFLTGTSMAAPHVAGVAALIKQKHPEYSPQQIKDAVLSAADSLGLSPDMQGHGLVNALSIFVTPTPGGVTPTNVPLSPTPTPMISPIPGPLLRNGSFETDENNDTFPEGWTHNTLGLNDFIVPYKNSAGETVHAFQFGGSKLSNKRIIKQRVENLSGKAGDRIILRSESQLNTTVASGKVAIILRAFDKNGKKTDQTSIQLIQNAHGWQGNKKMVIRATSSFTSVQLQVYGTNTNGRYRIDNFSLKIPNQAESTDETTASELSQEELNSTE